MWTWCPLSGGQPEVPGRLPGRGYLKSARRGTRTLTGKGQGEGSEGSGDEGRPSGGCIVGSVGSRMHVVYIGNRQEEADTLDFVLNVTLTLTKAADWC